MLKVEAPGGADRILLHSCCAPCSGAIIECLLANGITPTIFFSNSNITPLDEYELRKAEIRRYAEGLGLAVVDDDYDHRQWLESVRGLEREPERGARCSQCFRFRLERAARYAATHGFPVLATTLASSRWKDLDQVNAAGALACELVNAGEQGGGTATGLVAGQGAVAEPAGGDRGSAAASGAGKVIWWAQNWRKGGLQPRRCEIIREQNFYNQLWCGCEFSRRDPLG